MKKVLIRQNMINNNNNTVRRFEMTELQLIVLITKLFTQATIWHF